MFVSFMLLNPYSISYPLPQKTSGFQMIKNGIINKICLNEESRGVTV
jgi:hypothetical protein